jgi:hypothetical protein
MRARGGRFGIFASRFLGVFWRRGPGPAMVYPLSQAAEIVRRAWRSIDNERREPPLGGPIGDQGPEDSRAGEEARTPAMRGRHAEPMLRRGVAHAGRSAATDAHDAPQNRYYRVRPMQHARPSLEPKRTNVVNGWITVALRNAAWEHRRRPARRTRSGRIAEGAVSNRFP